MAVRIAIDTGEDKAAGVDQALLSFYNFCSAHNWEIEPSGATKTDMRTAVEEIWEALETKIPEVKSSITGALSTADDEQITVLAIIVVAVKLNQYKAQLPGGGPP